MKEKFLKRKWLRVLAAVCMSVMLFLSMVQGAFAAVSYTHLDVYKRQI